MPDNVAIAYGTTPPPAVPTDEHDADAEIARTARAALTERLQDIASRLRLVVNDGVGTAAPGVGSFTSGAALCTSFLKLSRNERTSETTLLWLSRSTRFFNGGLSSSSFTDGRLRSGFCIIIASL